MTHSLALSILTYAFKIFCILALSILNFFLVLSILALSILSSSLVLCFLNSAFGPGTLTAILRRIFTAILTLCILALRILIVILALRILDTIACGRWAALRLILMLCLLKSLCKRPTVLSLIVRVRMGILRLIYWSSVGSFGKRRFLC